mmetsp:Transcript_28793/g.85178  ORF Transcript_28793/g.85178 Transcript_28793/m.85178 type:complete len:264 (+) Transcript_28793:766-1557(+)
MAVLQQHPGAGLARGGNECGRLWALALAHRDGGDLGAVAHGLCKRQQRRRGVAASGQHKQQRRRARRLLVAASQVERRWLCEALPERRRDKRLDGGHDLVWPQAPQHHQALKGGERRVEAARQRLHLGRHAVVDAAPLVRPLRHVAGQRRERGRRVGRAAHLAPRLGAQPLVASRARHVGLRHAHTAGKQELLLCRPQAAACSHDAGTQQERKQQLVLFKQRATDVLIQRVREVVVDVPQALREVVRLFGALDRAHKQSNEPT